VRRAAEHVPLDPISDANQPGTGDRHTALQILSALRAFVVFSRRSRGCALRACPWLPSVRAFGARAASFGARAASFSARAASFGVRAASFGVRAASFGARAASFGVRAASFGVRAASFGVRAASFGARAASFGAPRRTHRKLYSSDRFFT